MAFGRDGDDGGAERLSDETSPDDGDRRDDDGPRTDRGEPSFPGVGSSQPDSGASTPDRGSDDDDDFTDRQEDRSRDTDRTDRDGPRTDRGEPSFPGVGAGEPDSGSSTPDGPETEPEPRVERGGSDSVDSVVSDRVQRLDPTREGSPGGESVGSAELERYLAAARREGATIQNVAEDDALAVQLERATGVDPRRLADRAGGDADVALDLEAGEFVATAATTRRRRTREGEQSGVSPEVVNAARRGAFGRAEATDTETAADRAFDRGAFGRDTTERRSIQQRIGGETNPAVSLLAQTARREVPNIEGGDAALFRSAQTDEETFGDIAIQNPVTGNRVEDDLRAAGEDVDAAIRDEIEESIDGPSFLQNPALNTASRFVGVERAGLAAAEVAGVDTQSLPGTELESGEIEGPVERGTEAAFRGAAGIVNVPEVAAEVKEIGEFAVTQPDRIAQTGDTAADAFVGGGDASPIGLNLAAVEAAESVQDDPFVTDVRERGTNIARTSAEAVRNDPIEATAGFGGGLAGGLVGGQAAAKVVGRASGGRVSGSDISGRVALGAERRIDEFVSDDRGQLDFGDSRSTGRSGDSDATSGIDMDAINDALERFERGTRVREAKQRARERVRDEQAAMDPPDATSVSRRDASAVSTRESRTVSGGVDASRSGPTVAEASAGVGRRFDLGDLSPREQQLAANLDTPDADLRTVADDVLTPEGLRVNQVRATAPLSGDAVGGLLGSSAAVGDALGRSDAAAESSLTGAAVDDRVADGVLDDVLAGSEAGVGPALDSDARTDIFADSRTDIFGRSDTRADSRSDTELRVDTRVDARQDIRNDFRADLRQDTRLDTRQDVRQDTRQDVRADTRQDVRIDTPFEEDTDDEDDGFGGLFAGLSSEVFDTGVVQSLDELDGTAADPFGDAEAAADDVFGDA